MSKSASPGSDCELDMLLSSESGTTKRVVYGVTVGISALKLLSGQLQWLGSEGWEVVLVTSPDTAASAAAIREEVRLVPLAMSRNISPVADSIALFRWIKMLAQVAPSAVNVSTPKAGLLGGIAGWIQRVPKRVYVVRGLRLEGTKGILYRVLWFSEWLAMRVATDVIFVSASLANEAEHRRLLNSGKSWIIGSGSSNGVNSHAVQKRIATVDKGRLREQLEFKSKDFVVGFIGRIARDKGIETLVQAFSDSRLNNRVRLLCIGPTEDEQLANQLRSLGNIVTFVPWTDDVWGYLPAIDLLCLPTLREGFPNVVLEAAAAGVPSITTRATGAIDSVLDGETGYLFDIGDSETLVEKFNSLATSADTVSRLGLAAKSRAESEFQQEKIWQGVAEILSNIQSPIHAIRVTDRTSRGESK